MNSGTAQVIADTALDLLTKLGFSIDKLCGQVSVEICIQHYTENHNLDVKVEANI